MVYYNGNMIYIIILKIDYIRLKKRKVIIFYEIIIMIKMYD